MCREFCTSCTCVPVHGQILHKYTVCLTTQVQLEHVTGNFFSLILLLAQLPSTLDLYFILELPLCILLCYVLFPVQYTHAIMHGILHPSLLLFVTLNVFFFVSSLDNIWFQNNGIAIILQVKLHQ